MGQIVRFEIPDGAACMGSHVVLEDGSRIRGIQEITLKAGVDQQLWSLDLKVTPKFLDQIPLHVELRSIDIGNIHDLSDEQLKQIGLQRITNN